MNNIHHIPLSRFLVKGGGEEGRFSENESSFYREILQLFKPNLLKNSVLAAVNKNDADGGLNALTNV